MRLATSMVFALAMLAGSNARADRRNCEVTFVRVPDDVRLVIESWLKAEPHCTGTIELRVVPTDSGTFYLIAQRPDGRIHEREVPDAQSAGVLVASWVADDWTSTPARDPEPEREPVRMAPSDVPNVTVTMPAPRATSPASDKWVTLGLLLGADPEQDGGFHLDIDLFQRGAWTFGVIGEYAEATTNGVPFSGGEWLRASDWRLLVKAARMIRLSDRATLTGTIGAGIVFTESTVVTSMSSSDPWEVYNNVSMESAVADIGLTIARELGDNWALTTGPKLTLTDQTYYVDGGETVTRTPVTFMMQFAVRYRL